MNNINNEKNSLDLLNAIMNKTVKNHMENKKNNVINNINNYNVNNNIYNNNNINNNSFQQLSLFDDHQKKNVLLVFQQQ
jgi:hypothetical protein